METDKAEQQPSTIVGQLHSEITALRKIKEDEAKLAHEEYLKAKAEQFRNQLISAALTGLCANPQGWDVSPTDLARYAIEQAEQTIHMLKARSA